MLTTLEIVAQQVEADIRSRGLSSGDRYLTGSEVGRMLNVSSVTANRAMQLLAERGLLVRQRKAGTFIGKQVRTPSRPQRQRIHFLLTSGIWPEEVATAENYLNYLLGGVVQVMPGVSIQADIVGPREVTDFVRQIVRDYREGEVAGVVLIRSLLETQRQLSTAGVPTVVFGSVFPGVDGISSVDVDQLQIGRVTAKYLLDKRHPTVLTLMLTSWAPGDNRFYSGLIETLQSADAQPLVELQSVPVDEEIAKQMIEEALSRDDRPKAIIARSPWLARRVAEVADALGLRIPEDVDLVLGNHHDIEILGRRIPGAQAIESMHDCGRELGQLLQVHNVPQSIAPTHKVVGVQFVGG